MLKFIDNNQDISYLAWKGLIKWKKICILFPNWQIFFFMYFPVC